MNRNIEIKWTVYISILFISSLFSCEHDVFDSGRPGEFVLSSDTVMFDTIFTNTGTATYKLMVYNPNNYNIEFDSVYLANKSSKAFIVNINGQTNLPIRKLTIDANDSLYIFIQTYINATSENNALINEDSLVFLSGNIIKDVKLIAYGQNVVLFKDENIKTQEWFNTKPYLIYGTLTVETGSKLTIHKGVKVYFHRNSGLKINGTLNVLGQSDSPVLFLGDRPENDYDTIPGQWGGIVITGNEEKHLINYAVIRNATTGLLFGDASTDNVVKAEISNTVIANMAYSALISNQGEISATNTLLANTGNSTCSLYGGSYDFMHCTLSNHGARYIARSINSPTLVLQNYTEDWSSGKAAFIIKDLHKAYFGNTIIDGSSPDEIDLRSKNNIVLNYTFENCLLKFTDEKLNLLNSIANKSPEFIHPENENFRLDSISPAKDAGKMSIGQTVPFDLENKSRTNDIAPDLGVYERKP